MMQTMALKGHMDIIYDITVSRDQKSLLTVGSDMMARLWAIPDLTGEFIDQEESEAFIMAECIHPSFVYCGAIIEGSLENRQFIVTGCYDGALRLWEIDLSSRDIVDCEEISIQ
jgi:WD40 repeat protein